MKLLVGFTYKTIIASITLAFFFLTSTIFSSFFRCVFDKIRWLDFFSLTTFVVLFFDGKTSALHSSYFEDSAPFISISTYV
jgi:hypothetical protein